MCKEKWIYKTTSNHQHSDCTRKKLLSTSQNQTCTRKKGHGHCFVVWCQSDPLQLSESWHNHYIWDIYSANLWDTKKIATLPPALIDRMRPVFLHDNGWPHTTEPILLKLNELGHELLSHLPYSPGLFSPYYHFFKHLNNFFSEKNASTIQMQKMFSKSSLKAEVQIFTLKA